MVKESPFLFIGEWAFLSLFYSKSNQRFFYGIRFGFSPIIESKLAQISHDTNRMYTGADVADDTDGKAEQFDRRIVEILLNGL